MVRESGTSLVDSRKLLFLDVADCALKALDPSLPEKDHHLLPFEAIITTDDSDLDGETVRQGRDGEKPRVDFTYYLFQDRRLGRARGNVHEGHTPRDTGVIPPPRMLGYPISADAGEHEALVKGVFNANPALPGGRRAREIWEYAKEAPGAYNPSFEALPVRNARNPRIIESALVTGLAISDKVKNPGTSFSAGWSDAVAKAIEAASSELGPEYQGAGDLQPQDRGGKKSKRRRMKKTHCRKGCDGLHKALTTGNPRTALGRAVAHLILDHNFSEPEALEYFHSRIAKGEQ